MVKSSSRDNLINSTIKESLSDNLRPSNKISRKVLINFTILFHRTKNYLFLDSTCCIWLFDSDCKSLKKCLVKNISSYEPTILRTFTFSIRSSHHIETFFWSNPFVYLFEINTFTLKNWL